MIKSLAWCTALRFLSRLAFPVIFSSWLTGKLLLSAGISKSNTLVLKSHFRSVLRPEMRLFIIFSVLIKR